MALCVLGASMTNILRGKYGAVMKIQRQTKPLQNLCHATTSIFPPYLFWKAVVIVSHDARLQ